MDKSLYQFMCKDLENEKLKIDKIFLEKLSDIISNLEKQRIYLIEKRAFLQNQITKWHKNNKGHFFNKKSYKKCFIFITCNVS